MSHDLRPPLAVRLRPVVHNFVDVALAGAISLFAILANLTQVETVAEPVPLSVLAGILMGLPLVVRRRWPCSVLAVVTGASVVALALQWVPPHAGLVPDVILVFALYPVALTAPARRAVIALVLSISGVAAAVIFSVAMLPQPSWIQSLIQLTTMMGLPVAVWVVARAVRARRAYEKQAAKQVLVDERLRIARDLHDGVAHSLSLITVQASVAIHVANERPDEARSALSVIEKTGREATRELRRMLGLLRAVDDDSPVTGQLEPAPTPARLAELADHARSAGVRVDLRVGDGIDAIPSTIGLAVYRIVQESLTNVVKHAAPASCVVRVEKTNNAVEIEVIDDGGKAPDGHPPGHGLIGMRERVSVYSGEFSAGPLPGRGFRVHAKLPLEVVPA